jgi:hypothetical protein
MTAFYSTAEDVIRRVGVQPKDLGWDEEEESGVDESLAEFIEGLLTEMSDLMNRKLGRDYLALYDAGTIEEIPPGLNGIGADIAADSLRTMMATRQAPIVRIDEFAVATLRARVFSEDILDRLRLYGRHGVRSVGMSNR